MQLANRSLAPFFLHGRMWPKWLAAAAAGVGAAVMGSPADLGWLPVGFLGFLVLEYALHRWILHAAPGTRRARRLSRFHANHHLRPRDLSVLFLPASTAILAAPLLAAFWAVLPGGAALVLLAGVLAGMAYYEYVHFTAHRVGASLRAPWLRWLRARHLLHHHRSERHWFGVSLPVLDDLLGSGGRARDVPPSPTALDILGDQT